MEVRVQICFESEYPAWVIYYQRLVRFQDVDVAGIVFFPNFHVFCHEAMEQLFEPLAGGYAGLLRDRRLGLPAVQIETQFISPLRHGDLTEIRLSVLRVGGRSLHLRYQFWLADVLCAEVKQVVVMTDLQAMKSCDMPDDVRRIAEQHLA